jgi:hypothetical protein
MLVVGIRLRIRILYFCGVLTRYPARILERQNVLQTSQVLLRRVCVSLAMVLPFKDSSEALNPAAPRSALSNCPNTPRWSEARPR